MPGASPAQLDAQLAALLAEAPGALSPRGIVFVCERGVSRLEALAHEGFPDPPGWLPVEVPCIGMVTPAWLLQSLNLGAAAVGVVPCNRQDCRFGRPEEVWGRVEYTGELLSMLGACPDRVRVLDHSGASPLSRDLAALPEPLPGRNGAESNGASVFTPRTAAQALLTLAEAHEANRDLSLTHPHSLFGVVEITGAGCTTCGACVEACPTRALALERDQEGLALTSEAGLCIGCGECAAVCPERVLSVKKATDLRRLASGRIALHRDSEVWCEACGGPIASKEVLEKIRALLGEDQVVPAITRYCLSCRGAVFPGRSRG